MDELLATVNATMDVDLTRSDVVGTYAGLRPLIAPSDGSTVKASREHRVTVEANGVVRIGGGKYTTYRVMARDVIDAVLGRTEAARARPLDTADRRLVGAAEPDALARIAGELATIGLGSPRSGRRPRPGWSPATGRRRRRSSRSGRELDLLRPLVAGRPFLEAEVAWAARQEIGALARRRPGAADCGWPRSCPIAALSIAPRVAAILGAELGWGEARQALEVQTYLASARREFAVPPPATEPTVMAEAAVG